jgi:DNA topoisomerase-1
MKKVKKEIKVEDTPNTKAEKKAKRKKKEAEEEEETFKWWEQQNMDDSIKWNTLEHNGVFFPAEYVAHGFKMKYNGELFWGGVLLL